MNWRIELDEEWKSILARSWSIRFIVITGILNGTAAGAQMLQPYLEIKPVVVALVVFACTTLATITTAVAGFARVVNQANLK